MTITYTLDVSSSRLCGFLKLLFRWKGSIYRLLYKEMLIFVLLYYLIAFSYRIAATEPQKRVFEKVSWYMKDFTELVPITFVLGFYVALIVGRWWQQYLAIPWIDGTAHQVAALVEGTDERSRLTRRALVRYMNLMSVLTFQATSPVVRKRFPTLDHLEEAGLLTMEERIALDDAVAPHGNWWVPSAWFAQLSAAARRDGRVRDSYSLQALLGTMLRFRNLCGVVWSYDWISVPLVYTQVVTIAVYSFFAACLLGRQYLHQIPSLEAFGTGNGTAAPAPSPAPSIDSAQYVVDYYVPVFTLFQFFFYMGWLKVAEEMICPFGEDDDDFELNWILDRNVQVGYAIVDSMYQFHPKLVRDAFWDESEPDLPYTAASATHRTDPFLGSTQAMNLESKDMAWENDMEPIAEEKDGSPGVASSPRTRPRHLINSLLQGRSSAANSRLSLQNRAASKTSLASGRSSLWSHGKAGRPGFLARHKGNLIHQLRGGGRGGPFHHSHAAHRPSDAMSDSNFHSEFSRANSVVNDASMSRIHSLITLGEDGRDAAAGQGLLGPPPAGFPAPPCAGPVEVELGGEVLRAEALGADAARSVEAGEEAAAVEASGGCGGWMEGVDIPPIVQEEPEPEEPKAYSLAEAGEGLDRLPPLHGDPRLPSARGLYSAQRPLDNDSLASAATNDTDNSRTLLIPNGDQNT